MASQLLEADRKAKLELASLIGETRALEIVDHNAYLILRGSNNNIYVIRNWYSLYNITKMRRFCVFVHEILCSIDRIIINYLWLVNRAKLVEIRSNQMEYLDASWVTNFVKSRRVLDGTMRGTKMKDVLKMITKGTGITIN